MPRNNREYLKRYAEQIEGQAQNIVDNCARILELYSSGDYEQIAFYKALGESMLEVKEMVAEYRRTKM